MLNQLKDIAAEIITSFDIKIASVEFIDKVCNHLAMS